MQKILSLPLLSLLFFGSICFQIRLQNLMGHSILYFSIFFRKIWSKNVYSLFLYIAVIIKFSKHIFQGQFMHSHLIWRRIKQVSIIGLTVSVEKC